MDAFTYLSVLLSIILGLAITQVLAGYRALLLGRARVRLYWPSLVWSGTLLLIAVQSWWASFGLAAYRRWTFLAFAVVLLQTILLYMMTAVVFPDLPEREQIDLEAHYRRETTPFFLILLAMLAVSLSKDLLLAGHLPGPANLAFHGLFAALALTALAIRRDRMQAAVACAVALLTLSYIGLLFARL